MNRVDEGTTGDPLAEGLKGNEVTYRALFESLDQGLSVCELVRDPQGKAIDYRMVEANHAFERQTGLRIAEVVGRSRKEVGLAMDERFLEMIAHAVEVGESVRLEQHSEDLERLLSVGVFPLGGDRFAKLYNDITEQRRAEEALASDLRDTRVLRDLSMRLIAEENIQAAYQEIMDAAVVLAKADRGTMHANEGGMLRIVASHGHEQSFLDFFAKAEEVVSACGSAAQMGGRVIVPDVETSPLFTGTTSLSVLRSARVRAVLSTPLVGRRGDLLGILTTQWDVPHEPNREDLWRLDLLARQAAEIIERRRSERSLIESEERFRALVTSSSDVVYRMSPDWKELRYLQGSEVIPDTNDPSDLWIGKYLHPDDRSLILDAINKAIRERGMFELEHRMRRMDGTWGWILSKAVPILNDEGEIAEWFGTAKDITERKRTEGALKESEAQLAEAQRITRTGSWSHDLVEGKFSWSDELYRIFGVNKSEVGGHFQFFLDNIHPEDRARVLKANLEAMEFGDPFHIEYRILTPGGRVKTIREIGYSKKDECGKVVRLFGTAQDITDQKRTEARLRRSNAELQQFAYVASHDLQEPLRMVTMYIALLSKRFGDELSPLAKEYMRNAVEGSSRMKELIDDLLQYSRLDSRQIDQEPVDMNAVARQVVENLDASIREAGARVTIEPLPAIPADEQQIGQVLQNLLSNAIKFRSREPPRVRVSAVAYSTEYVFSVEDNGIGIDQRYADKLFKMFSRLHDRSEYQGTGIGLAIAKKIVERHGGRIWFASEPGKGSTFFFTIPIKNG